MNENSIGTSKAAEWCVVLKDMVYEQSWTIKPYSRIVEAGTRLKYSQQEDVYYMPADVVFYHRETVEKFPGHFRLENSEVVI